MGINNVINDNIDRKCDNIVIMSENMINDEY